MSDTPDTTNTGTQHVNPTGGASNGNTNLSARKRYWFYTWNFKENPEECEIAMNYLKTWGNKNCTHFVFQPEIGEDGGNLHIQGYMAFKNARQFSSLQKEFPGMHLLPCRNVEACIAYCQKEETRAGDTQIGGSLVVRDPLQGVELYPWQTCLVEIIDNLPDDRSIYWIYDQEGNCGKTTFAKHLCIKYPNEVIYLNGGPSNCKFGVMSFLYDKKKGKLERNEKHLRVAIFDLCRTQDDRVSYQALEEIKNGIFFNTKYESMQVVYNCPHVIVFANFLPDESKLSSDRWKIINLGDGILDFANI